MTKAEAFAKKYAETTERIEQAARDVGAERDRALEQLEAERPRLRFDDRDDDVPRHSFEHLDEDNRFILARVENDGRLTISRGVRATPGLVRDKLIPWLAEHFIEPPQPKKKRKRRRK